MVILRLRKVWSPCVARCRQRGVTYLWALFFVMLLSLGLGRALDIYLMRVQREREADLLVVGAAYREAIQQYYLSSPGGMHKYPQRLEDLLRDPRHLVIRRYLRSLYPDPMTGREFELIIAPEGGIWGVRSASVQVPLKTGGFRERETGFANAEDYRQWQFIANDRK